MRSPFKSFVVGLVLALVGGIWAIGSYIYVVFEKPIAPNPEGSSILLIPRGTPYSQVKKELQELGLVNQPRLFRYLSLYLNVAHVFALESLNFSTAGLHGNYFSI